MLDGTYVCDQCGEEGVYAPGPGVMMLPPGWVKVDQGLGLSGAGSGMSTMALPEEVDLLIQHRTFCCARHLAAYVLDNLGPS